MDELPIEAQLNCRADSLAIGLQLKQPPPDLTKVPPMPAVSTQIHMNNNTITTKHLTNIRRLATSEPLKAHIKRLH